MCGIYKLVKKQNRSDLQDTEIKVISPEGYI